MKIASIVLAAALLVPAALSAQNNPPQGGGRGMMGMRNAAAVAVAHKDDLGLSDEIVTKLQALDKAAQEKNAPIMKEFQDMRANGGFQSMSDDQRQAFRAKMQQVRDNNQATRTDVEKLLTADQVKKLGDIIQQEMPQRGPRPNG